MIMKKLYSRILSMLLHANTKRSATALSSVNRKISKGIQKWIEDKGFCRSDQTVSDFAEEIGVTEESLAYYSSAVLGERFSTFRKRLRLTEAHRLIEENPKEKIHVIAFRVGISDKANFRRQFYEQYGMAPSEWQKECMTRKK